MGYLGKNVEASFKVEYDVTGRVQCRQCKKKMNKTELRMGKQVGKSREGMIHHYFHPNCLILNLKRCRIMSRNIETADSIFGIDNLLASDYALISSLVEDLLVHEASKSSCNWPLLTLFGLNAMTTCLLSRLEVGSGSQTIPMTKRC